jgi:hypothetical protein
MIIPYTVPNPGYEATDQKGGNPAGQFHPFPQKVPVDEPTHEEEVLVLAARHLNTTKGQTFEKLCWVCCMCEGCLVRW